MRFFAGLAAAAALSLLFAAPAVAQGRNVPGTVGDDPHGARGSYRNEVRGQVEQLVLRWRDAWATDDLRAMVSLYERDAVLMTQEGSALRTPDEIRAHFARALPRLGDIQTQRVDFGTSGDLAYEVGQYSYEADASGAGVTTGSYVLIARRHWDGTWGIQSLTLNDAETAGG